jgi:flagellar motor protein MotB
MYRFARHLAVLALISTLTIGCASSRQYEVLKNRYLAEASEHDRTVRALQAENEALENRLLTFGRDRAAWDTRIASLEAQKAEAEAQASALELEFAGLFGKENGWLNEVATRNDTGSWDFDSELLFKSGSAELTKDGHRVLTEVANRVKGEPLNLIIIGHTDSDPIKSSKAKNPTGMNLQLGMRRATSVAHAFNKAGVHELRMQTWSKGMAEPKSTGKADKKLDRRVEIYFVKGEVSGLHAPAIATPEDDTPQK